MYVSQYGLGFAGVLLIGAIIARKVMLRALENAEAMDAQRLGPEQMAEKRKVKNVVTLVLNAELVIMPVIGYLIGHFYLDPR